LSLVALVQLGYVHMYLLVLLSVEITVLEFFIDWTDDFNSDVIATVAGGMIIFRVFGVFANGLVRSKGLLIFFSKK